MKTHTPKIDSNNTTRREMQKEINRADFYYSFKVWKIVEIWRLWSLKYKKIVMKLLQENFSHGRKINIKKSSLKPAMMIFLWGKMLTKKSLRHQERNGCNDNYSSCTHELWWLPSQCNESKQVLD